MVVFDFDGVLLDSVKEASVSAYNSVQGALLKDFSELPGNSGKLFVANCHLFRRAGDTLPLMRWCLENSAEDDAILAPSEFVKRASAEEMSLGERSKLFFKTREKLMDAHPEAWLALSQPYEPLWSFLRAHSQEIALLTNKNRRAVLALAEFHGLGVKDELVFSGDAGLRKSDNFKKLQAIAPRPTYYFVEDSLGNLLEVRAGLSQAPFAVKPLLVAWGYLGPEDLALAAREGIEIVDQQDIMKLFPC